MRHYVIIPLRELPAAYHHHARALRRLGIEPRGLIRYGILYGANRYLWTALNDPLNDVYREVIRSPHVIDDPELTADINATLGGTYQEICGYLQRDIMSTQTNLLRHEVQQLMHSCLDHIQLIDQYVLPFIFSLTGSSSTLRYEKAISDDSILVSVESPLI